MKKIFKALLLIVATLVVGGVVAMFAIGKSYHYEKSMVINAPVEVVYSHISSAKAFNEWNPWMDLDPNIKVTYSGTQGQVGDQYCWESESENAGKGCHKFLELIPNKGQKTEMIFEKPFENKATSQIVLTPENGKTKVTWDMDTELEYPMNLMKLMMDKGMEESYTKGLERLKQLCENNKQSNL